MMRFNFSQPSAGQVSPPVAPAIAGVAAGNAPPVASPVAPAMAGAADAVARQQQAQFANTLNTPLTAAPAAANAVPQQRSNRITQHGGR
jgi:hypothetical protein